MTISYRIFYSMDNVLHLEFADSREEAQQRIVAVLKMRNTHYFPANVSGNVYVGNVEILRYVVVGPKTDIVITFSVEAIDLKG